MNHFQKILIIFKVGHERAGVLSEEIFRWLADKGIEVQVRENAPEGSCTHPEMVEPDLIVILGGDGTMFSVVRSMKERLTPVIGINLGQVGFLTEISPDDWRPGLQRVLEGEYLISERTLLAFRILRDGQEVEAGQAVNDLVVCRGSLARLLRLKIFYGQERIGTLRADGIIVSTATGATAYTVSAGGPLIHPELDVCTLTPICPFLSGFTPMVLPFDKEIRIIVDPSPVEPYLTVDGQVGVPLRPDDEVRVFSRKRHFLLVQPSTSSYFKKLKTKGFILED